MNFSQILENFYYEKHRGSLRSCLANFNKHVHAKGKHIRGYEASFIKKEIYKISVLKKILFQN